MRARTLLLSLSVLAGAGVLAGCAGDDADESEADDNGLNDANDTSATCLEGAPDCDDTPTMETVDDPYQVGT